jgi:hypothetical protein
MFDLDQVEQSVAEGGDVTAELGGVKRSVLAGELVFDRVRDGFVGQDALVTPASDDGLTNQPSTTYMINHQPFWTHWRAEMADRFTVWREVTATVVA